MTTSALPMHKLVECIVHSLNSGTANYGHYALERAELDRRFPVEAEPFDHAAWVGLVPNGTDVQGNIGGKWTDVQIIRRTETSITAKTEAGQVWTFTDLANGIRPIVADDPQAALIAAHESTIASLQRQLAEERAARRRLQVDCDYYADTDIAEASARLLAIGRAVGVELAPNESVFQCADRALAATEALKAKAAPPAPVDRKSLPCFDDAGVGDEVEVDVYGKRMTARVVLPADAPCAKGGGLFLTLSNGEQWTARADHNVGWPAAPIPCTQTLSALCAADPCPQCQEAASQHRNWKGASHA